MESERAVGRTKRFSASVAICAFVSGCGGGGGGGGGGGTVIVPPTTPPPTAGCTLAERQAWAAAQINEWYLFPELIATGVNASAHASVESYVDALVAPARAQNRDRFFTYVTSIAEENAFFNSGSSAGFGIRLSNEPGNLVVMESFEGGPALAAGIDRGTRIEAIGTTEANLEGVNAIYSRGGANAVTAALGPSTAGVSRVLRITDSAGTRNVTVTKADFAIDPVSDRYGTRIIDDGGRKVGYVNLRTFIDTADANLRGAFAQFRAQGITEVIVDFRYNGGGLVRIAELMNDLLLGRPASSVQGYVAFRASKSSQNETVNFAPQPQSISGMKVAFIGTGSSASASELVMNAALPYLGANAALIGTNTYGKPVGQIALDRAACDDRLRVIAFATQNSARQGDYYTGLASKFQSTCRAPDDLSRPLGDPNEASTRAALDFLAGRPCAIGTISDAGGGIAGGPGESGQRATAQVQAQDGYDLLTPDRPTTPQREIPGFF